jgi:hypothetical protein
VKAVDFGRLASSLFRGGRAGASPLCPASGWRLRAGSADGPGSAVCPSCSRRVATRTDRAIGPLVLVVEEHGRRV